MPSKTTRSPLFAQVRRYFERGLWSASRVEDMARKGRITEEEKREILEGDK